MEAGVSAAAGAADAGELCRRPRHGRVAVRGRRKLWFFSGLLVTLGLLFVFKYLELFRQTLHDLAGVFFRLQPLAPLKILLPIGISFFTFKIISYLIDVYYRRIEPETHLGIYALYVSFFPQLLAGPIERAARFIPQLKAPVHFDWERVASGMRLVVWGLFKKMVIADRLAFFVDEVFRHPEGQGLQLLLAVYFYAFQIYCDFSGYSDIAVGITRVLGFESMKNFDFPYFARSITQFWSRWHISLSSWLRDYLFLPIAYAVMRRIRGEKLLAVKAETWGYFVGIFLTMLLGGLWHGASWTFVIWGGLYGVYQVFSYSGKRLRRKCAETVGTAAPALAACRAERFFHLQPGLLRLDLFPLPLVRGGPGLPAPDEPGLAAAIQRARAVRPRPAAGVPVPGILLPRTRSASASGAAGPCR